jgi:DNA-binding CsgD family transcriptional regulator
LRNGLAEGKAVGGRTLTDLDGVPVAAGPADCALAATESLELGIVVCDRALERVLYANPAGHACLRSFGAAPGALTASIARAAATYEETRRSAQRPPPAVRLERPASTQPFQRPQGSAIYVRTHPAPAPWRYQVVLLQEEVLRDPDLFSRLEQRYHVTSREFEVLGALRMGKTNRQIAAQIGLSTHGVAKLVHRLLVRFDVPSRKHLALSIDEIAAEGQAPANAGTP